MQVKNSIRARGRLRACLFFLLAAVLSGIAAFALLYLLIPLDQEQVTRIEASPALYDARGRLFHLRLSSNSEWQIPIPLSEMGKWLPLVAVGVEDGRFYRHPGIDPLALLRATVQNIAARRVISGASTITSQLIRLSISEREPSKRESSGREPSERGPAVPARRARSLGTKVREFIQAMKLERVMTKEKILENYLNQAPFGGNIRGVQAASLLYFGKPALKLSPGEACLMIGMLKGPTLYRPDLRPEAARRRRDTVIRFLRDRGVLTSDTAQRALLEDLPHRRYAPPLRAFHFAELVLENGVAGNGDGRIDTTLDLKIQTKLESLLRQSLSDLPREITLSAGIVDNRTARLVGWVGNARFGDGSRNAWVDCGRAPRSPGSLLKPFAYLSAIDQGFLTASSLLADSSMAFSGRAPRNFDLSYRGAVSTRVALAESLNAPAVRVLRLAGPDRVLLLMRECGLAHLTQPATHYGDSLILGGCEVTVMEALEAYTALASLGRHRPLSLTPSPLPQEETRMASEAACWIVSDILDNRSRLTTFSRETLGQYWHVALKTGTSYGLRDAWSAAWTPDYTAVVWVGNPEGDPWPGLVGAKAAAPVAVKLLRTISPRSSWYGKPAGLGLRTVCALSGQPPTAACTSTRLDWSIEGVTQTTPCSLHVIRRGQPTLMLPAEFSSRETPQEQIQRRAVLSITSPIAEAVYTSAPLDLRQRIPMRAEGAVGRVWWYLDGIYIGSALPNETFFHRVPDGRHVVGAVDEEGRSAFTNVSVVTPGRKRGADILLR